MAAVIMSELRSGEPFADSLVSLTPEQVVQIDRALASIGPFGEVRLVKVKGRVRFIQKLDSHDLLQGDGASGVER